MAFSSKLKEEWASSVGTEKIVYGFKSETLFGPMKEKCEPLENGRDPAVDSIIKQAQGRSEEAFHKIYEIYSKNVFNLAHHLSGDYESARDLTQEIFLKVYEKLASYRGESHFSTWLYRMALNTCLDFRRKSIRVEKVKAHASHPIRLTAESAETEYVKDQRRQIIHRALAELSPKHRAVLVLQAVEELSYPEMAAILGCSEGTVASRLNKGRKLLYEKLKRFKNKL